MTVLENLEKGCSQSGLRESFKPGFELFPILRDRDSMAGSLSGGEQQMLAVSRSLMTSPILLMLDEPSLGLAPMIVKSIFLTVREINARGISILLLDQNVFYALSSSHRGFVMETGEIVMEGKSEELLKNDHVKRAYLGV
jgi:branched-chain amino acid transport system ATP-binding protein